MSSRNENQYWRQREEEALKHYLAEEEEYQKRIDEIYADMLKEIQSEIDRFYRQYAIDEEISLAEAKKRISAADIREYERKAAQYVEDAAIDRKENGGKTHFDGYYFSEAANDEMRIYNATMKINRLEMLKANIGLHMVKGHAELETFMERILQGRTEDELKRQAGILGDTVRDNAKDAQTIVHASFHHATFSERIWASHERMKADLAKLLQTGLIRGVNARKLAGDMREYVLGGAKGGARFNAERLMRTELARVQIEAQKKAFIEMGFEDYTFHANPRCCDACQMLNGKHFKIRDMMSGENAPPMHPLCKCSISAYEDRKEYEEWLDSLAGGGTTEEYNKFRNVKLSHALLDFSTKSSIIKVNIDELTPCLCRMSDGKIVDTEVVKVEPKKSDFKDWEFDWSLPLKNGYSVYGIVAKDDSRIQGLIALKANLQESIVHVDIVEAAPFNNPHHPLFSEKEYSGVGGHLFAEAVRQSYEAGFDGVVYFMAKSSLIEHYEKELGATLIDLSTRVMFIDEKAANKLYDRYYGGKENEP